MPKNYFALLCDEVVVVVGHWMKVMLLVLLMRLVVVILVVVVMLVVGGGGCGDVGGCGGVGALGSLVSPAWHRARHSRILICRWNTPLHHHHCGAYPPHQCAAPLLHILVGRLAHWAIFPIEPFWVMASCLPLPDLPSARNEDKSQLPGIYSLNNVALSCNSNTADQHSTSQ